MASEILTGQKIGNYVVTRLLGQGGMGSVYLARHPEIGREVAIKVMDRQLTGFKPGRFVDEASAATRIGHPNIIEVYDLGRTEEGQVYYVMELLEGRDLGAVIDEAVDLRERMTPAEVLPYLEQICAGLQAAHDAGIVHRDLKPENVFVVDGESLRIKLLDFGIAKLMEREAGGVSSTATGALMGTPLIMAPEQAAGKHRAITQRTDIYSLGVILFWMLSGRPPFEQSRVMMLLADHIKEPAPLLSDVVLDVPAPLSELIQRCMEKDPELRPASAGEVLSSFATAVAGLEGDDELEAIELAETTPKARGASGGVTAPPPFGPDAKTEPAAPLAPCGTIPDVVVQLGEDTDLPPPGETIEEDQPPLDERAGLVLKETYRLERLLGKGGMGMVYEASHLRLTRRFAVKLLFPEMIASPAAVQLFHREAEVTSRLGHENIVEVVDFDHTPDGVPYLVMELLEGEDLDQRIARLGSFDLEQTTVVLRQLASALAAAHEQGVVHRDLKPKNIFLCPVGGDEVVKVLDFGISKIMGGQTAVTRPSAMLGSLLFMPPEQTRSTEVDQRADIYAAGAIVYAMLGGRPPFSGEDLEVVYQQVLHEPPPSLRALAPDVPELVEEVVWRALAKQRDDRYESITEFSSAFERAAMRAMSESFDLTTPAVDDFGEHGPETARKIDPTDTREDEEPVISGSSFSDISSRLRKISSDRHQEDRGGRGVPEPSLEPAAPPETAVATPPAPQPGQELPTETVLVDRPATRRIVLAAASAGVILAVIAAALLVLNRKQDDPPASPPFRAKAVSRKPAPPPRRHIEGKTPAPVSDAPVTEPLERAKKPIVATSKDGRVPRAPTKASTSSPRRTAPVNRRPIVSRAPVKAATSSRRHTVSANRRPVGKAPVKHAARVGPTSGAAMVPIKTRTRPLSARSQPKKRLPPQLEQKLKRAAEQLKIARLTGDRTLYAAAARLARQVLSVDPRNIGARRIEAEARRALAPAGNRSTR